MDWILRRESAGADPEQDIAAEMALLEEVLRVPQRPILRLWRVQPCLVVTPLLAHRADFTAAAETSRARGWPVVVRRTGGGPVPQIAGTLNVSLALATPRGEAPGIDPAFRGFADWLCAALRGCGLAPETGEIAGSCCPGRYDISIPAEHGPRKIIGIAQRRRQGSKDGALLAAILVHAMVWLDGDLPDGIDALETLLRDAGASEAFARSRMGTLQEIAGVEPVAFEEALLAAPF